jgi:phage terminase small subunit
MSIFKPAYEAFCRAYVAQPDATLAARSAGYSFENAHQQGYRLIRRTAILRRIGELRAELAERECLAPGALLAKLEIAFHAAIKKDQPAAAARIVETQAKLAALLQKSGAAVAGDAALDATRNALNVMAKQMGLPAPRFEAT